MFLGFPHNGREGSRHKQDCDTIGTRISGLCDRRTCHSHLFSACSAGLCGGGHPPFRRCIRCRVRTAAAHPTYFEPYLLLAFEVFRSLTPEPPPFSSMNSTPAISSVFCLFGFDCQAGTRSSAESHPGARAVILLLGLALLWQIFAIDR